MNPWRDSENWYNEVEAADLACLTPQERQEFERLIRPNPLREARADPVSVMTSAALVPDPWQADLLRRPERRSLLLCCRSAGKSSAAAALALADVLLHPGALVLVLSPSERQSGEFAAKVWRYYEALGRPVAPLKWTDLRLDLANGSRLIALPGNERTVRTYNGARRLIIDEAARVPDDLYRTVRPMVAVSHGSILALSTPFGQRGWFYEEFERGGPVWSRQRVTAWQCPRIPRDFLEEERIKQGPRWFAQEWECRFCAIEGAVFDPDLVDAAFRPAGGSGFGSFFG